jgi:hypothetical protein
MTTKKKTPDVLPQGYDALSPAGRLEYERTGKMPTAAMVSELAAEKAESALVWPQPGDNPDVQPQLKDWRKVPARESARIATHLAGLTEDINEMAHMRAASGGGSPVRYQNAMRYIRDAIAELDALAKADGEAAKASAE